MIDRYLLKGLIENGTIIDLATAMEISKEARIICQSVYPYKVLFVNKAWTLLTNFEQHEMVGESILRYKGPFVDKEKVIDEVSLLFHVFIRVWAYF